MTVFVIATGGLAILSFLIFGKLSRDFLVFDANRTMASNEIKAIQSRIKELEGQLQSRKSDIDTQIANRLEQVQRLDAIFAKREATIASQQARIDEYEVLSEKLTAVNSDHLRALDALKSITYKALAEQGGLAELKAENSALTEKRQSLQAELVTLEQKREAAKNVLAQMDAEVVAAKQEGTLLWTKVGEVKKTLADVSTTLTNQNIRVASARSTVSRFEDEVSSIKETYDTLSAQVILAKETVKARLTEISDLEQNKQAVLEEIDALELRKSNAESQTKVAEANAERAARKLQTIRGADEASPQPPTLERVTPIPVDQGNQ